MVVQPAGSELRQLIGRLASPLPSQGRACRVGRLFQLVPGSDRPGVPLPCSGQRSGVDPHQEGQVLLHAGAALSVLQLPLHIVKVLES